MTELMAAADAVIETASYIERDCAPHAPEVPYDLAVAIDRLARALSALRAAGGDLL